MRRLDETGLPSVRTQIVSTQGFVDRIEDWRRRQENEPSKSEAIRQLVERGLEADETSGPRF